MHEDKQNQDISTKKKQQKDFEDYIEYETAQQQNDKLRRRQEKNDTRRALDMQVYEKRQKDMLLIEEMKNPDKVTMGPEDTDNILRFKHDIHLLKK